MQQLHNKIHCARGNLGGIPLAEAVLALDTLGPEKEVPRHALERGPKFFRWATHYVVDAVELVDFCAAAEDGESDKELNEDTGGAPHVDSGAVGGGAEEDLWGTVPEGDDAVCIVQFFLTVLGVKPCEAEVGNFQLAVVVEEDVAAFNVAVEYAAVVEVVDGIKELTG